MRATITSKQVAIVSLLNATYPSWIPAAVERLICSSLVCVDLMAFKDIARDDCECNAETLAQVAALAGGAAEVYAIGLVGELPSRGLGGAVLLHPRSTRGLHARGGAVRKGGLSYSPISILWFRV